MSWRRRHINKKKVLIHKHFSGLQTFESTETTTKEPQEPEAKPEVQEEQKGKNKPFYCIVKSMELRETGQDICLSCRKSNCHFKRRVYSGLIV